MQSVTNIFDQLRLSPPIPGPLHKRTVDAADLGTTAEVLAAAKALTGSSKVVAAVRFSTSGNSRNEIRTGTSTKRSKPSTMRERK